MSHTTDTTQSCNFNLNVSFYTENAFYSRDTQSNVYSLVALEAREA